MRLHAETEAIMRGLHENQRLHLGLLLIGVTLFCSSCLYSRLLSFKEQLASFDEYVIVTNGGHTLEFLKPVIEEDDLTQLTGFSPTHIDSTVTGRQTHTYLYESLPSAGETGTPRILSFTFRFASNELFAFDYPPVIAEALGTNLVAAAAKALGKSRLMQREHSLDWTLGTNQTNTLIPSSTTIAKALGPSQSTTNTIPGSCASYVYRLLGTNGTGQAPATLTADFKFDPRTSLLSHGVMQVGNLKLVIDFPMAH